jgi:CRISPR system Cascade subunit CasD
MRFLLMRLEAPLMSFGGPMIDNIGRTRRFPGQAQIAGLFGNALGWCHGEAPRLDALQRRLRIAAALDRPGELLRDFHTVDLGQPHLVGTGWTTRGAPEKRAGASGEETHIRHRWYLADARLLLAVALVPDDIAPTVGELASALDHPARPLFIGRKNCVPADRLSLGVAEATDALLALREAVDRAATASPASTQCELDSRLLSALPAGEAETERLVDGREWENQAHTVERLVVRHALGAAR